LSLDVLKRAERIVFRKSFGYDASRLPARAMHATKQDREATPSGEAACHT
jgi:hypothetical protein